MCLVSFDPKHRWIPPNGQSNNMISSCASPLRAEYIPLTRIISESLPCTETFSPTELLNLLYLTPLQPFQPPLANQYYDCDDPICFRPPPDHRNCRMRQIPPPTLGHALHASALQPWCHPSIRAAAHLYEHCRSYLPQSRNGFVVWKGCGCISPLSCRAYCSSIFEDEATRDR